MKKYFSTLVAALVLTLGSTAASATEENVNAYNPFEEMRKMHQEMDAIFEKFHQKMMNQNIFSDFSTTFPASPDVDLEDKGDSYILKANIPGCDKKSIKISEEDGMLKIEAKSSKEKEEKSENFLKKERFEGAYLRALTLPSDADIRKMENKYENGVLTITIPKKK